MAATSLLAGAWVAAVLFGWLGAALEVACFVPVAALVAAGVDDDDEVVVVVAAPLFPPPLEFGLLLLFGLLFLFRLLRRLGLVEEDVTEAAPDPLWALWFVVFVCDGG